MKVSSKIVLNISLTEKEKNRLFAFADKNGIKPEDAVTRAVSIFLTSGVYSPSKSQK